MPCWHCGNFYAAISRLVAVQTYPHGFLTCTQSQLIIMCRLSLFLYACRKQFEVDLQPSILAHSLCVLTALDVLSLSTSYDVQAVPLTLTADNSPK